MSRPPTRAQNSRSAAVDLWDQMLDRMRNNEWSTFDDPEYEVSNEEKARVRQSFLDAGWTEKEIDSQDEFMRMLNAEAPVTSPGVAKLAESALHQLSSAITGAVRKIDKSESEGPHFAVEPKGGPFVSTVNVMMTDESIVTMGAHFTRYCGLVSRAYIRTLNLNPYATGIDFDEKEIRSKLKGRPDLLHYWWRIFASYAFSGTHALVPFKPSSRDEIILMEQMAYAMEIFALAHEYAHHALRHGRTAVGADAARAEEFEADQYALKICEAVEEGERFRWLRGKEFPNPYLSTGAGGVLLLGSLEIFRKVKAKIYGNVTYDTHPHYSERAEGIKRRFVLQPSKYATAIDFCSSAENILNCVMSELNPIMQAYPFKKLAELNIDDWEEASFR